MPPPLCGLNWHGAGGGRRGAPEAEPPLPPGPLSPPGRRAPPPGARVGGSRRVPGAAGHEAPPPAARPGGTHFVQDAASPLIVGPEPAAALVRALGWSARRTPTAERGADPAGDPGESFLSRGERARPGAARGMRDSARRRRRRGPGPGPGARAARRAGEWPAPGRRGGGDRAARCGGCGPPPLPTLRAGTELQGEVSLVLLGGCGLGSGEALE